MSTTLPNDTKRRDLAVIHIAAKELGMDPSDPNPDSEYRSMLWAVARVRSARELDHAGRQRVKDHLRACGFQGKPGRSPFPGRPHNVDIHPQLKKIEALLADAKRPWAYADALAKRMFGKDRVGLCNGEEWQGIIAALVHDQRRRSAKGEAK